MTEHQSNLAHPKYRPDIDGLRAVAVLAVVAFHAFPSWVKGGFIGVDVFFVISGYLISTILYENLDRDTFSFYEFYARRIKRIFPSLFVILSVCYTFGWFVLIDSEYRQLGKQIFCGASFVSNIEFWSEAGYFDKLAELKPLLHLWSLGIEEQFYILWPVLLWLSFKNKINLVYVSIVVALLSFCINIRLFSIDSAADFYFPFTRFWELMSGSILAYCVHKYPSIVLRNIYPDLISCSGFIILVFGFIYINISSHFPGYWATVPVLGSLLIILAGKRAWLNRILLSNNISVTIGLISYPLYLWHWPLLSFGRILNSDTTSLHYRLFCVLISIILAWLTYKFVEIPFRYSRYIKYKVLCLVLLMVGIGFTGLFTYYRNGLPSRGIGSDSTAYDGGINVTLLSRCGIDNKDVRKLIRVCQQDSRSPIRYALLGDSKASAMWSGIVRTSTENGRWLFIGGAGPFGSPVPVISDNNIYKQYQPLIRPSVKAIAENKDVQVVVLVTATRALFQHSQFSIPDLPENNYQIAFDGLKSTIDILKASNKKVVLVIDNPTLADAEDCVKRVTIIPLINRYLISNNPKCQITLDQHLNLTKDYRRLINELRTTYPNNVFVFDPTDIYCDHYSGLCSSVDSKTGRRLYSYSDHISDYASGLVGTELNKYLSGL
jgi:peptidoglycan/LPS O-acetylase OafA/YrhL